MNNTITIELPGVEAKLDRIIELLETVPHCTDCAKNVAEAAVASTAAALRQAAQESVQDVGEVNTQPEEETPTEAAEANDAHPVTDDLPWTEAPAPEQPTITHADIQKKVVALSAAGKKTEVRDAVLAYGNVNVSGIPADKLTEVWDKLTALEG